MKKTILSIAFLTGIFFLVSTTKPAEKFILSEKDSVASILEKLGDEMPAHKPDLSITGVSAERGKDIVLTGIAEKPFGGKTGKQSKHFVCTSCHNIQKEDPDLSVASPEARLKYAKENGLPFLQGTTLYGAVNRSNYYNGDYEKKYGDLVEKARNDLREAIQLCAIECSQGRALKDWEMESVLAYLWEIDLKMGDLNLNDDTLGKINNSINNNKDQASAIQLIKAAYLQGSPASFVDAPEDRKAGYSRKGNPQNGQDIYELSCLHCHENKRYSYFDLDNSKISFNFLENHFPKYDRYSVYQVGRYGTSPLPGKKAYMPNYTKEKMSDQMMDDLRAYVEQKAWGE